MWDVGTRPGLSQRLEKGRSGKPRAELWVESRTIPSGEFGKGLFPAKPLVSNLGI